MPYNSSENLHPIFLLRGAFLVIGVILLAVSASLNGLNCQGSTGLPTCIILMPTVLVLDGFVVLIHLVRTHQQLAGQPGGFAAPSSNGVLADAGCAGKHFRGVVKFSLVATISCVCILVSF
jgi:hypothetical protein